MHDDRERAVTRTHTVAMKARAAVLRPESRNAVALRRTAVVVLLVIVFIAAFFLMRPGATQAAYSSPSPQTGMTVDNSHVHTSTIPSEPERKTVLLLTEGLHGRCADIMHRMSCHIDEFTMPYRVAGFNIWPSARRQGVDACIRCPRDQLHDMVST